MEQERKKLALLKLFTCYPSAMLADKMTAQAMVAAYSEMLSTVSAEAVESACRMLAARSEQFPPSAGVLFDKAREIEWKRKKADAESAPRLCHYVHAADAGTPEERAERKRRVAELVSEFKRQNVLQ